MSDNKFNYTYSAPTEQERREIDSIRRQYEPQSDKEVKLQKLRTLNGRVQSIPQIISLCIGVLGLLIFGLGLSMILVWSLYVVGGIIIALGFPVMLIAYPVYNFVLNEYKKKYGGEILKLSDELLNEKQD
ncbi:MAG: hypothetical protein J6B45_05335 [Clostridia bacterium]|nr:hypothetical protein [Clostridia bacterium]